MLEFALVTVLLLLLLFGIVDFGRALYTYHFLANASREATRWASVNGQSCITDPTCPNGSPAQETDVQQYVAGLTPPGISKANIQGCDLSNTPNALGVCANWSTAPSLPGTPAVCTAVPKDPGCPVQVTVSYNFGFLVPLVHKGVLQMSSSSETIISH